MDNKQEILSTTKYSKQFATINGHSMAYVDTGGDKDPIVFIHGNITSSYMWRNIMPHVEDQARCIAIDNIGQGDSEKLKNSHAGSYRLAEHQTYIDGLLAHLDLGDRITFMLHDWGGALGLTWACNNPSRIKGLAYTQTLMGNLNWDYWPPHVSDLMRRFRSKEGEELVLNQNYFVEKILPAMVIRDIPQEVFDEYRRPYANAGEDRRPTLTWPREIPVEGEPADVLEQIETYMTWLKGSPLPKLFIHCEPETVLKGHILEDVRKIPNQHELTVPGLHYVHEDSPHQIGQALSDWYAKLD